MLQSIKMGQKWCPCTSFPWSVRAITTFLGIVALPLHPTCSGASKRAKNVTREYLVHGAYTWKLCSTDIASNMIRDKKACTRTWFQQGEVLKILFQALQYCHGVRHAPGIVQYHDRGTSCHIVTLFKVTSTLLKQWVQNSERNYG